MNWDILGGEQSIHYLGYHVNFLRFALVAVLLPTYIRIDVVKVTGRDDYSIIAAMICYAFIACIPSQHLLVAILKPGDLENKGLQAKQYD
jgi:hypothetical protein